MTDSVHQKQKLLNRIRWIRGQPWVVCRRSDVMNAHMPNQTVTGILATRATSGFQVADSKVDVGSSMGPAVVQGGRRCGRARHTYRDGLPAHTPGRTLRRQWPDNRATIPS